MPVRKQRPQVRKELKTHQINCDCLACIALRKRIKDLKNIPGRKVKSPRVTTLARVVVKRKAETRPAFELKPSPYRSPPKKVIKKKVKKGVWIKKEVIKYISSSDWVDDNGRAPNVREQAIKNPRTS